MEYKFIKMSLFTYQKINKYINKAFLSAVIMVRFR